MTIWEELEKLDKAGDLGDTYRVTPKTGSVERVTAPIVYDYVNWDAWAGIEWPSGLDYRAEFHSSMFLEASNWEWHLEQFVNDGVPFRVQCQAISADDNELVGWVMMVKVDTE